jgi:LacI family transcriptional regulator
MTIENGGNGKGGGRQGHWTMQDIADRAHVSPKTISRVINEEQGVSESTRERVLDIIKEVGYVPHTGARSMRGNRRDCVGLTVSAPMSEVPLTEDLFLRVFSQLYRVFGKQGTFVCFDLNPFASDPTGNYGRGLWEHRYSACVICGPLAEDDEVIHRVHEAGFPYLALSRLDTLPEVSYATVDYVEAARLSTEFLIKRGHSRIGMIQGFKGFHPTVERERGYEAAYKASGLEMDAGLLRPVNFGSEEIPDAVHAILSDPTVTAIIDTSGAEDAESLREGARRAGRTLSEDVELVAWTYTQDAVVSAEACAHVWLPVWEAAVQGISELHRWFHDEIEGPVTILLSPRLYETPGTEEISKARGLFDLT